MSDVINTFEVNGYTVEIIHDDDAPDPRQDINNGVMFAEGHNRYVLGDAGGNGSDPAAYNAAREILAEITADGRFDLAAIRQRLIDEVGASVVLPLYLLDHSGLAMRTSAFGEDPGGWDSGVVGFIFDTPKTRTETGCEPENMEAALRAEVATYSQYLEGDVYGYRILDGEGEEVDSCWGFLGLEWVREAATEAAEGQDAPQWLAVLTSVTEGVTVYGTYPTREDAAHDGSPLLLRPAPERLYRLVVTEATASEQYTLGRVVSFSLTHATYTQWLEQGWKPAS